MEPPMCEFHLPPRIENPRREKDDFDVEPLFRGDCRLGVLCTGLRGAAGHQAAGISALPGTTASTIAFRLKIAVIVSRATHCKPGGGSLPRPTPGRKNHSPLWLTGNTIAISIHSGGMTVQSIPPMPSSSSAFAGEMPSLAERSTAASKM